MCVVSSTSCDCVVIAASVVSGGISDTALTNVVFPTPKPPATTSLTDCTFFWPGRGSERPNTVNHPCQGREFDLDRVNVRYLEVVLRHEVADEHHRDAQRRADVSCDLGDAHRFEARLHDPCVLKREVAAAHIRNGLHHRF